MFSNKDKKPLTWRELLSNSAPVQLPAAHDALTARLIERAGFAAYQIGGFALVGARHGLPDIDLTRFAEQAAGVRDIMAACSLPVLVDADDGYGDVKNVTHTVRSYEALGVSAIFLEDQVSPKRCGHMQGKSVVPPQVMEERISAAASARRSADFFLVARTDAREPEGLELALRRAEKYVKAGADGIYVEAPKSVKELEQIGKALPGTPQMTNMFEGDKETTPWLTPKELGKLGFSMILYPTTILFRVVTAIEHALADLKRGKQTRAGEAVDMTEYEQIVGLPDWAKIENRFQGGKSQ